MINLLYVCYDTSIWTEFGYTIQRYIGSSIYPGIRILAIILGVGFVADIVHNITGVKK